MKRLFAAALAVALLTGCSAFKDDRWQALFRDVVTAAEEVIVCSKTPSSSEIGLVLSVVSAVPGIDLGEACDSSTRIAVSAEDPFFRAALGLDVGDHADVVLAPDSLSQPSLGLTETRRAQLPPRRALSVRPR